MTPEEQILTELNEQLPHRLDKIDSFVPSNFIIIREMVKAAIGNSYLQAQYIIGPYTYHRDTDTQFLLNISEWSDQVVIQFMAIDATDGAALNLSAVTDIYPELDGLHYIR